MKKQGRVGVVQQSCVAFKVVLKYGDISNNRKKVMKNSVRYCPVSNLKSAISRVAALHYIHMK